MNTLDKYRIKVLRQFANKAECNYPTSQRAAHNLWLEICGFPLTKEEFSNLSTEWTHSQMGDRGAVAKVVRDIEIRVCKSKVD